MPYCDQPSTERGTQRALLSVRKADEPEQKPWSQRSPGERLHHLDACVAYNRQQLLTKRFSGTWTHLLADLLGLVGTLARQQATPSWKTRLRVCANASLANTTLRTAVNNCFLLPKLSQQRNLTKTLHLSMETTVTKVSLKPAGSHWQFATYLAKLHLTAGSFISTPIPIICSIPKIKISKMGNPEKSFRIRPWFMKRLEKFALFQLRGFCFWKRSPDGPGALGLFSAYGGVLQMMDWKAFFGPKNGEWASTPICRWFERSYSTNRFFGFSKDFPSGALLPTCPMLTQRSKTGLNRNPVCLMNFRASEKWGQLPQNGISPVKKKTGVLTFIRSSMDFVSTSISRSKSSPQKRMGRCKQVPCHDTFSKWPNIYRFFF